MEIIRQNILKVFQVWRLIEIEESLSRGFEGWGDSRLRLFGTVGANNLTRNNKCPPVRPRAWGVGRLNAEPCPYQLWLVGTVEASNQTRDNKRPPTRPRAWGVGRLKAEPCPYQQRLTHKKRFFEKYISNHREMPKTQRNFYRRNFVWDSFYQQEMSHYTGENFMPRINLWDCADKWLLWTSGSERSIN